DVERLVQAARELCDDQPRTFEEIRAILVKAGHAGDERAMGYAVRMQLPLVQVPSPGAAWGYDARAPFAVADSWLGAPLNEDAEPQALVVRYLAAFGPASAADAGVWSGLRGLREVFETLRPELLAFRDERGRELFDLPAAPRPPGDVEAPVRFLPDFDNLVLAHEDRTRLIAPEHRARIVSRNLQVAATFLVDGVVAGTWKVERKRKAATLVLTPFAKVPKPAQRALEEEGLPLLAFLEPDALEHGVRVAA
ncbi:MAG: winged helix DNA-binding domain-containing protein, partial [Gemmatimonadaceae bacterium]